MNSQPAEQRIWGQPQFAVRASTDAPSGFSARPLRCPGL